MPDNLQRKKALDGDADMLMALTRDLMKDLPRAQKDEAAALLKSAWMGDPNSAYEVSLDLMAHGAQKFFHTDHDFAIFWMRLAARQQHKEAMERLPKLGAPDLDSYKDPFAELDGLVGLANVKQAIAEQASRMEFIRLRVEQGLPAEPGASIHLVFTGNPGTGKTTVARIFGRLLKQIGYLKSGHVVEVSVPEMIGKWVGETPQKVAGKVQEAMDGVLFIDEAYGLLGHTTHTGNSYGAEAVTTLLKLMEDNRDRLVVIAAGYTGKMQEFLESNPGLKSRFTEIIAFPDYSAGEMAEIYYKFMREGKYTLAPDAKQLLGKIMAEAPNLFPQHFPNARLVRNLFEDSIKYLASRVIKAGKPNRADLTTITARDLELAFAELNRQQ